MRSVLLILGLVCTGISGLSASRPKHEIILGRVVAYSIFPTCLNGNGYWALIIRIQRPKDVPAEFIRVDFTLPCRTRPEWLVATPPIQKFNLFRQKDCEALPVGSEGEEPKQKSNMPHWEYLRGTEPSMLPSGQVVHCYRPVDPPEIAPIF
jgi:hypothetical protein